MSCNSVLRRWRRSRPDGTRPRAQLFVVDRRDRDSRRDRDTRRNRHPGNDGIAHAQAHSLSKPLGNAERSTNLDVHRGTHCRSIERRNERPSAHDQRDFESARDQPGHLRRNDLLEFEHAIRSCDVREEHCTAGEP